MKKRLEKNEHILRDLWENIKWSDMGNKNSRRGIEPDEEEKISEEIMAENFPNLMENTDLQIQEAQ